MDMHSVISSLVLAAMATAGTAPDPWSGDGGAGPFYDWQAPLPAKPGVLLRHEAAPAQDQLPQAAQSWRILYTSTDFRDAGRMVTVSGTVWVPRGKAPRGGWPVIAWAHGTTGIADVCAPSFTGPSPRDRDYLGAWLAKGYAVVASDYAGLGTPGVHPYLQYRSEGLSMLDGLTAATRGLPGLSTQRIVVVGQSQGSQAAISTADLAPRHAPHLGIRGVVATGLIAEESQPVPDSPAALYMNQQDPANTGYEAVWLLGTARSVAPGAINPEDYVSPAGLPVLKLATTACFRDIGRKAAALGVPVGAFYKVGIRALELRIKPTTDYPAPKLSVPVFVGTGLKDEAAPADRQRTYVAALCHKGTRVTWHGYAGEDHGTAVMASLKDSGPFVAQAMAGKAPRGNCPG
jgi:pimeloyl-ACP methyl ester carboxylesterase